jgi:hypothetical protein
LLVMLIRLISGGIIGWLASLFFNTGAQSRWLWVTTAVIGGLLTSGLMLSSLPGANVVGLVLFEQLLLTALLLGALISRSVAKPLRCVVRR